MAIFRPEMNSGSSSFYGVCEIAIKGFKDRSSEFDWADIFIDVIVNQKGSEYTRNIKVAGSVEKDTDGNITGGSVLKRMYVFFDAIGCKAGLNIKGEWEDEKGEKIKDIGKYLEDNFVDVTFPDSGINYNFIAYVYKEKPKKEGDKAWTRVYHKIYSNNKANVEKLLKDVTWLKGRGVIKEATDIPANSGNSLQGSGLSNL
jgi:hypothetical protein